MHPCEYKQMQVLDHLTWNGRTVAGRESEQEETGSDAGVAAAAQPSLFPDGPARAAGPWSVHGLVMYEMSPRSAQGSANDRRERPRIGRGQPSKSLIFQDPPTEEDLRPFWRGVSDAGARCSRMPGDPANNSESKTGF